MVPSSHFSVRTITAWLRPQKVAIDSDTLENCPVAYMADEWSYSAYQFQSFVHCAIFSKGQTFDSLLSVVFMASGTGSLTPPCKPAAANHQRLKHSPENTNGHLFYVVSVPNDDCEALTAEARSCHLATNQPASLEADEVITLNQSSMKNQHQLRVLQEMIQGVIFRAGPRLLWKLEVIFAGCSVSCFLKREPDNLEIQGAMLNSTPPCQIYRSKKSLEVVADAMASNGNAAS
ncbi:hypothetical protein Ancab_034251 [Ancistrocladus abbreviatus]